MEIVFILLVLLTSATAFFTLGMDYENYRKKNEQMTAQREIAEKIKIAMKKQGATCVEVEAGMSVADLSSAMNSNQNSIH